ncbi:MAG: LCP family protein [Lachnospiraceae bacterium]|nr:LCP family protein [Lachnospiraceae bacterium]
MRNKKIKKVLLPLCAILLAFVLLLAFASMLEKKTSQSGETQDSGSSGEVVSQADSNHNTIVYEGNTYEYNSNLENYLFLGVDTKEEVVLQETPGTAGQADCIMVLSVNRKDKTARILQISRDSMTDIDLYDINGNYFTSVRAQIATQYAYGNGKDTSCWAMKKTVSRLLYDLPLEGCMSLNIDGIHAINDAVGGVTLTVPEDYTSIDPAFIKGTQITLNGEQAERYVRYRDIEEEESNNDRMRRQVQYIPALIAEVKEKAGKSGDYYETYQSVLAPYLVTDLNANQINRLTEYSLSGEVFYVPGEIEASGEHEEFLVDEEKLKEMILKMFYKLQE